MLAIGETSNHRDAEISIGDTLKLKLSENPTTGYRWRMPDVGPALRILEDSYDAPTGGGGPEAAALGIGPWPPTKKAPSRGYRGVWVLLPQQRVAGRRELVEMRDHPVRLELLHRDVGIAEVDRDHRHVRRAGGHDVRA